MDIEQIRTFIAVAANGSFFEAANRLYVTQSTVSARIQNLENYLGAKLYVRNRSGATLTVAGQRFLRHAKSLLLTLEQAQHEVGLPSGFRASITVSARIALWEDFLPRWACKMREKAPDISIRSEIGFEEDIMRRLVEGTLDIGLMYTPRHIPGLQVEHLFDETLMLLSANPDKPWPDPNYVYIDWGPGFYAQHNNSYPELASPAQIATIGWLGVQLILRNNGSCFLPLRLARPLVEERKLYFVDESPRFKLPAYMVFQAEHDSVILDPALAELRSLGADEQTNNTVDIADPGVDGGLPLS